MKYLSTTLALFLTITLNVYSQEKTYIDTVNTLGAGLPALGDLLEESDDRYTFEGSHKGVSTYSRNLRTNPHKVPKTFKIIHTLHVDNSTREIFRYFVSYRIAKDRMRKSQFEDLYESFVDDFTEELELDTILTEDDKTLRSATFMGHIRALDILVHMSPHLDYYLIMFGITM